MTTSLLTNSPAEVLRKRLLDLATPPGSLPESEEDWPIFVGLQVDSPVETIVISDTLGTSDGRLQGTGETQEHPGVQIRIRSEDYQIAWRKAVVLAGILDTQIRNTQVTIVEDNDETYLYTIQAATRGPIISLGLEQGTRRMLFTINALLSITED